jgi:hypothetical protein
LLTAGGGGILDPTAKISVIPVSSREVSRSGREAPSLGVLVRRVMDLLTLRNSCWHVAQRLPRMRAAMATPFTPTPSEGPVLRSVDVDLDTPAPASRARAAATRRGANELGALGGGSAMNQPSNRSRENHFGASAPLRLPGHVPTLASPPLQTGRPYAIRPTPTFSFTEEMESSRRMQQRPPETSRAGGGVLLLVLMLLAGSAGYVAVKYRVWQDTGPLVQRSRELARSLRTLAPWASPEMPAAPAPAPAPAPSVPKFQPEIVPLPPEPARTTPGTHRRQ